MAEILLGRLLGPSGFDRAVVIKRILPHLARQKQFRTMFLDEARIVAGITHPNVVSVQELGRDGDDIFLVFEYLEGESLSMLVRALVAKGATPEARLCAHVLAEACAGLHAAHEIADPDLGPRNLVHRDVSPQNVFLTYDGQVKVIDFGIATATDRITRTETSRAAQRQVRVHVARAVQRQAARSPIGHLLARHRPLRGDDGAPPLQAPLRGGDGPRGRPRAGDAALARRRGLPGGDGRRSATRLSRAIRRIATRPRWT